MQRVKRSRSRRTIATIALACAIVPSLAMQTSHAGPNLLPNPSFERSIVEPPPPVPPYTNPQPLVPEGWAFEGLAGFFDHSQNDAFHGRRMAAISIPASGKRTVCTDPPNQQCVNDPSAQPKEQIVARAYSLPPAWRPALPVPVNGGQSYVASAYMKVSFVTAGEAAVMRVRWLDAAGVPISIVDGPKLVSNGEIESNWTFGSKSLTAPSTARSAVILLGHTTDAWLGNVRFDQVFFG